MLERIKRSVDGLGPVTVLLLGALVGSFLTMLLVSSATGLLGGQGNVVESSGVLNTSAKSGFNETRVEVLVHRYVNRERVERGKGRLELDPNLSRLARLHSTEMARNGYVGHAGPEGDGPTVRAGELGVGCSGHAVGENVLRTYYQRSVETSEGHEIYSTEKELARGIVNQWMDSEGHRRNLLWEGYEREGVGVRITRSGEVYVTQNLC